jgi:hypothetical protein
MKQGWRYIWGVVLVGAMLGLVEAQYHFVRAWIGGQALGQRGLATQVLGQYLAEHYRGQKAIIFSNPFTQKPGQPGEIYEFEKAGLRGLRRGLGSSVSIEAVVFPDIRPEFQQNPRAAYIPATTTPLSYMIAGNAWDETVKQHPGAGLLISLIGLPVNLTTTETWKRDQGPKIALLLPDLRMVGNQAAIRQAVHVGKIAAMILNKPGAPPEDQPLGRDLKMEFEQRFLLVTPETVDQYLKAYPRLF